MERSFSEQKCHSGGECDEPCCRLQVYQELDDDLQAEFANYLHERGIDEKLGDYLITLVNEKEQEEYKRWLGNVRNFVTK